jgi:RNA polymerase sigma factor (sigma-70 family)
VEAEASRRKLWGIAYRVTGCAADADEIVQESFARMLEARPDADRPVEAWLVTVATRLSIDRLRRRKETPYDGPWLPSPVETPDDATAESPETRYGTLEDATIAYLMALELLTPEQRAALVLRDVFDLPAREAGVVLGVTEDNVRALHHRARARLASGTTLPAVGVEARRRTAEALQAFFACVTRGDARGAVQLLREDACTYNDGAGVYHAARRPVLGADRVARLWLGLLHKRGAPSSFDLVTMNGLPVVDARFDHGAAKDAPRSITGCWLAPDGRIATLFAVLAPRKLVHLG